jgi:NAD(P)-dependent dehydrogenase (short-subunit alcohol dehydrogenase family)
MELTGQIAIVTGGGRGIGRATALELARLGADIVIAEMDQAGAKRTAEEVGALGRRAVATATDVTSRADLRAIVKRTKAGVGRGGIHVNSAGI